MSGHVENLKSTARQALGAMASDEERVEFCDLMAEWFLEESERVGQAEEGPS